MADSDDARLRATEEQMRRALGLRWDTPPQQPDRAPSPPSSPAAHPHKRRFVRDGEVPVTLVHREHRPDENGGTNQLEQARQAIRAQVTARERTERQLEDAQARIRDLETKLAHERLAHEEALQRLSLERETTEQALRAAREELATSLVAARAAAAASVPEAPVTESPVVAVLAARKPGRKPGKAAARKGPVRRRTEMPEEATPEADDSTVVEWWKPGWRKRFR